MGGHLLPVPTLVNRGRLHAASWKFEALLCTVTFSSLCFVGRGDCCMLQQWALLEEFLLRQT